MYGIDISNHQKGIDLRKGDYSFALIKATEGVTFVDKCFKDFADQLTVLGKSIGCYHFARPDLHKTPGDFQKEADHFIATVKDACLLGRAILVLDWEKGDLDREDLINAWVVRVESQTGITPFIYASNSWLKNHTHCWAVKHCPIWNAMWPSATRRVETGKPHGFQIRPSFTDWIIWQYSAVGTYPGYSGNVDLDYTQMSPEEWKDAASPNEPEYVDTDSYIATEEEMSEAMEWAVRNGIIKGDPDGNLRPRDPATREEVATMLMRMTDIFKL